MNLYLDKDNIRDLQLYWDEDNQNVKLVISTKESKEFVVAMNECMETVNIYFDK